MDETRIAASVPLYRSAAHTVLVIVVLLMTCVDVTNVQGQIENDGRDSRFPYLSPVAKPAPPRPVDRGVGGRVTLPLPLEFLPVERSSVSSNADGGQVARASYDAPTGSAERSPSHGLRLKSSEPGSRRPRQVQSLMTVMSALSVVCGLFLGYAWLMKRRPSSSGDVASQIFTPLGTHRLTARHELQVARFGNKILALFVHGAGVETVAEIVDPDEVARLSQLCETANPRLPRQIADAIETQLSRSSSLRGRHNGNPSELT